MAVQAAAWHLNNDLSWKELAAKTNGRKRLIGGEEPYFTAAEITQGKKLAEHARASAPSKSHADVVGAARLDLHADVKEHL